MEIEWQKLSDQILLAKQALSFLIYTTFKVMISILDVSDCFWFGRQNIPLELDLLTANDMNSE